MATVPTLAYLAGPPYWYSPFNRAIGIKNQDSKGAVVGVAGFLNGRVPEVLVSTVVSNFGSGGSIALF